jgi:uncharacterized protein YjbJ (UPF0337 family)
MCRAMEPEMARCVDEAAVIDDRNHCNRRHQMNWDTIEGKWKQMTGEVKAQWGKLTNDDMDVIAGNKDKLVGKIQERYGYSKEEAEREVNQWGDKYKI